MPRTAVLIGKKSYEINLTGDIAQLASLDTKRTGQTISIRIGGKEPDMVDEAHHGTRSSGHDDAERRDDGLDAGSLNLNTTIFGNTINALVAANAQLVAQLGEITATIVHAGHLERDGLTVAATASQSIVSHTAGDAVGHEGHQTPLKQSGAEKDS